MKTLPLPKPKGSVEDFPQPALPSPAELDAGGYKFSVVDRGPASPVRLHHNGFACGIFVSPEAAGRTIVQVTGAIRS